MDYEREQREAAETAEVASWAGGCSDEAYRAGCMCPECKERQADEEGEEDSGTFDEATWCEENSDRFDSWDEVFA